MMLDILRIASLAKIMTTVVVAFFIKAAGGVAGVQDGVSDLTDVPCRRAS